MGDIVRDMAAVQASIDAAFASLKPPEPKKEEPPALSAAAGLVAVAPAEPKAAMPAMAYDPVAVALAQGFEAGQPDPLATALAELGGGDPEWAASFGAMAAAGGPEMIPEDITFQQAYAAAQRETYPEGFTVRVTGLEGEDDLQPEQLQQHFALCGDVRRVTIKVDRNTGFRNGCAYVDFSSPQAAETAVALNGSELSGHTLQVMMAFKNPMGGKGKKGKGKGWGKSWGKGKGKGFDKGYMPY
mmetsp:Transcript_158920/g.509753  ORF Transcript_158920/g.509753 Transcript_158920/m.509753 type:complete len:243 (+) Transcript_158920:87-815(+)